MDALRDNHDEGTSPAAHCILYRADGSHQDVAPADLLPPERDDDLLWIDIGDESPEALEETCSRLQLPADVLRHLSALGSTPLLRRYGDYILVHAVVVEHSGSLRFDGTVLGIAAGRNIVLTVHHKPVEFISAIRKREQGDTRLGNLSAPTFVAALLDWHLGTYFSAVADFERAVERLEEALLDGHQGKGTRDLVALRRGASRLRRMLAPHRGIFSSLGRPDFQPGGDAQVALHFQRLEDHFDRAMDTVENARDLVIGSFELFSNQLALRTNDSMRVLTFATVVIGCQTAIAGALGMNFKANLFAAPWGFWGAIGAMLVVTALAVWWGRRKSWI